MNKNILPLLFLLTLGIYTGTVSAQSKTNIKKHKVKSITTYDVVGQKKIIDEKASYDPSGEVTEEFTYNKTGALKAGHKYKRASNGEVTEETELDENNKIKEKRVVKYNEHGEKAEEMIYDGANKLIKKNVYTYDDKGFKTERKTYDDKGKLKASRLFVYEYMP